MDHARDILNALQRQDNRVTLEREGLTIHEWEQTDRNHARAVVYGKDAFAIIEVTMLDQGWPDWPDAQQGPILYKAEPAVRVSEIIAGPKATHVLNADGSLSPLP
jgi:hypothetical protein